MQKAVFGFFAVLFSISLVGSAGAQTGLPTPTPTPRPAPPAAPPPGPAPCPSVSVQIQGPPHVRDGQRVNFVANIAGGDPKVVPTIIWSTPGGAITQGQNTRRIEVDTTGAGSTSYRDVRAEVWVGGYAPECILQASAAVKVIGPAVKYAEFGPVDEQTLKKNLEAVSAFVSQSPDNLYLIAYAGRNSERGFASNSLRKIKELLVTGGVEARRIGTIDGGFREEPHLEFWIVPIGADPPRLSPTIKRSEIVYPNTPPRKKTRTGP
jgi:hypothetical protein